MSGPSTFLQGLSVLIGLALAAGLAGVAFRSRLWFAGRPAATSIWPAILDVPRRYLVDVHHAVDRTPKLARMHITSALGLLGLTAALATAWAAPRPAAFLALAASAALAYGAGLDLRRRRGAVHLSQAWYRWFPWSLLSLAICGLASAAVDLAGRPSLPLAGLIALLALPPAVHLSFGLAGGPMRHAPVGLLHLLFHPRPERFIDRRRGAALKPLDLDAAPLGARTARDLPWVSLLDVDACVQCGKCEAACPALAAGQPLNPKALIADLAAQAGLDWIPYAGNGHPGSSRAVGDLAPETLWSCTTCRACVEACPMLIEHVDVVVAYRRGAVLEDGAPPERAGRALAALRETGNATAHDPTMRTAWTAGLNVPRLAPGREVDILLWQGEGAFQPQGRRTLRALVAVLEAAGASYGILGDEEIDCGDLARRIGDEVLFQDTAAAVRAVLARYPFKRIVTADPHVLHTLRNEYPALGGGWTVQHHTDLLRELIASGGVSLSPRSESVTYHDPCYLARYNREVEAPREVLKALGLDVREMVRSGFSARCCGGGGAAPLADVPGKARISDQRMGDALETGASTLVVACPGCATMLDGVSGERPDVRDVAELVAEALQAHGASRP